jgi:hypothetical protein
MCLSLILAMLRRDELNSPLNPVLVDVGAGVMNASVIVTVFADEPRISRRKP